MKIATNNCINDYNMTSTDCISIDSVNDNLSLKLTAKDCSQSALGETLVVTFSRDEINMICDARNRHYYKKDIEDYFEREDVPYDYDKIMADTQLIEDILDVYAELRSNANGGDRGDLRHWEDCLEEAIDAFSHRLDAYIIEE